jgi:hypothetical protein
MSYITLSPDAAIGAKNSRTNLACSCALSVFTDCIGVITMTFADNNISIVLDISNLPMLPLSLLYILLSSFYNFFAYMLFYGFVYIHNFHKLIMPS